MPTRCRSLLDAAMRAAPVVPDLTPPEIAERLRVHADKVRHWIERGELEAVNLATSRCGRPRYRVSAEALERFLERRQVLPRSQATRQKTQLPPGFVRYYRQPG